MASSGREDGRAPAFQMYPQDYLADINTRPLSLEEHGAYMLLLLLSWSSNGLPQDHKKLAGNLKVPLEHFEELWETVGEFFPEDGSGKYRNPRQERQREEQAAFREQRSRAGQASAEARRARSGQTAKRGARRTPEHERATRVQQASNPSPSSSPSSSTKNHPLPPPPEGADLDDFALNGDQPVRKPPTKPEAFNWRTLLRDEFPELVGGPVESAWERYVHYRRELRLRPLKVSSTRANFRRAQEEGSSAFVSAVDLAIEKGWHGIHPPKEASNHGGNLHVRKQRISFAEIERKRAEQTP